MSMEVVHGLMASRTATDSTSASGRYFKGIEISPFMSACASGSSGKCIPTDSATIQAVMGVMNLQESYKISYDKLYGKMKREGHSLED